MKKLTKKLNLPILLLILLFIFSLTVRLINLGTIPANLNPDEADTLRTYLNAKYWQTPLFFNTNWNGAPAFNTYLLGISWEIFNQSIFGLRFPSALISSFSVLLFFLLGLNLTKNKLLSFSAALALSVNPWFLNFSRSGWENIFNSLTLLLVFFGFYFLYVKNKNLKAAFFLILGCSLSFYFYHPGKLFFPITVFTLLVFIKLKNIKSYLLSISIVTTVSLVLISPQLISTFSGKNNSLHRILSVSVLQGENSAQLMKENLEKNLKGFLFFDKKYFTGYLNARYLPSENNAVQPVFIPFYLIGILVSIAGFPHFVLFYFISFFPVEILSLDTPDAARAVQIVPAIYLFIALGINFILETAKKWKVVFSRVLLIVSVVLLLVFGLVDLNIYFNWIKNPQTLNSREPAVSLNEYPLWLSTQTDWIKNFRKDFTVGQWKEIKKQLPEK